MKDSLGQVTGSKQALHDGLAKAACAFAATHAFGVDASMQKSKCH